MVDAGAREIKPSADQRRLQDMHQEKPDYQHYGTSDAMNEKRGRLPPAGSKNVGHIAEGDEGKNQHRYADCSAVSCQHQS